MFCARKKSSITEYQFVAYIVAPLMAVVFGYSVMRWARHVDGAKTDRR